MNRFTLFSLILLLSVTSLLAEKKKDDDTKKKDDTLAKVVGGLNLRSIGPAVTGGRLTDIAVNPQNHSEFIITVACGGAWKTTNSGISWTPVFDNYKSYSMACVVYDPQNPLIGWLGTGENNSQRSVGYGDGVYKSTDGGSTWKNAGLEKSEHIGKIVVDPTNSDIVYVAAQGPLWAPGGDRGVYKTTDGGKTWTQSLKVSDNTGANDIVMDPRDPKTLYCSSYQRRRHVWTVIDGGPEGAIYKSTDAGASWEKLSTGLPGGDLGKIGLAISPEKPDVVYATIEATEGEGGFFRSTNRGASWTKMSSTVSGAAQYYQEIFCDPIDFDYVYMLDTYAKYSSDGGKTWNNVSTKERHVDDHLLWIDPDNNRHVIIGGDGGLYETYDRAESWRFFPNLPITQFYRIQADNTEPFYYVYGGTQDNNSLGGPSRSTHEGGVLSQDWIWVVGGDGYEPQIDPVDPNIVYGQWQYGNVVRFDKKSGEQTGIQPKEGKGEEFRWNWDTPFIISPHSHTRLYIAANYVFRSDDMGNTWQKISPDITRQIDRNKLSIMGKVWMPEAIAKNQSTSLYGNAISLAESPVKEGLLYVGTDDGLIQVTEDNGATWRKIDKFPGVPDTTYVSDIFPSRLDANVVYASFNNHKRADFKPYILKSTDKGATWTSISSNLPENGGVWTIEEDTKDKDLLFVGTEFGLFFTNTCGKSWTQLKSGMPVIAVRDLDIQERENDLVAGTFGRGIYILDDYTPLRDLSKENLDKEAMIFPIKDALEYNEDTYRSRHCEGETFYRAKNPDYGAVFTYYLKDTYKTKKDTRFEKEKELEKAGKTPTYPTFGELREEDLETAPYLIFTIYDASGKVLRELKSSPSAGINRITWDLRYSNQVPANANTDVNKWSLNPVIPGKYSVSLSKVIDGKRDQIAGPVEFVVKPLNNVLLPAKDRSAVVAFEQKLNKINGTIEASNKVIADYRGRLAEIENTLAITENNTSDLLQQVASYKSELVEYDKILNGDQSIAKRAGNQTPSINDRIGYVIGILISSSSEVTETNKESYKIASDQLKDVISKLNDFYTNKLLPLNSRLDSLNAAWTPGRLPKWDGD